MKLAAVDRWVIGYSLLTSLVALLFAGSQQAFIGSHLLHFAAIVVALAISRWVPDRGGLWPFLRHGYPILLFGLFYRDTAGYIHLLVKGWLDPAMIRFEAAIFGVDPVTWIGKLDAPWLLDFWMVGYFSYYLLAPIGIALMLWQRQPEVFRRMTVAACAAFFISYTMFYLFPLEGPRYALQDVLPPLKGVVFYPMVMWVQNAGSIHGGCMPSSHTAVAWIVTYYSYRVYRPIGRVLVVLSSLLTVGCVWGRFHYPTDVVVGLAIFVGSVYVTERYNARRRTGLDPVVEEGTAEMVR